MDNTISELKQRCLDQISIGLTRDLEAAYIQAYATLSLVEKLHVETSGAKQHRKAASKEHE